MELLFKRFFLMIGMVEIIMGDTCSIDNPNCQLKHFQFDTVNVSP